MNKKETKQSRVPSAIHGAIGTLEDAKHAIENGKCVNLNAVMTDIEGTTHKIRSYVED